MTFPYLFSLGKDVEPEDGEILKAMKTDEGRRQMSALLALRKEFAEGHLKMIYQNSEGNRSPVSPSLFRRLNGLDLLLPQRGIRRYVCKAGGLQHGRFFVSDGRELIQPEVKNIPRTIQAVSPNQTKGGIPT